MFGVLFDLFAAGGSVATAERRLALMEELELVSTAGVSHPTEAKGKRRAGVGAVLALLPPPLLDSVVPQDGKVKLDY